MEVSGKELETLIQKHALVGKVVWDVGVEGGLGLGGCALLCGMECAMQADDGSGQGVDCDASIHSILLS